MNVTRFSTRQNCPWFADHRCSDCERIDSEEDWCISGSDRENNFNQAQLVGGKDGLERLIDHDSDNNFGDFISPHKLAVEDWSTNEPGTGNQPKFIDFEDSILGWSPIF